MRADRTATPYKLTAADRLRLTERRAQRRDSRLALTLLLIALALLPVVLPEIVRHVSTSPAFGPVAQEVRP